MTEINQKNSSVDYRVTSLLTEHFGFPPLALIDDVINAVNEIMYKCTVGIETYLKEKRQQALDSIQNGGSNDINNNVFVKLPSDEIEIGTGKLETLLENQVDKNFDKFELYTLRNIMTLPSDLVEEGWIKLKHHEGISFGKNKENQIKKTKVDNQINNLISNIKLELHLRKIFKLQIQKAKKVIKMLELFRDSVKFLNNSSSSGEYQLSQQAKDAFKALSPVEETLFFLLNQVDDLIKQTRALATRVNEDTTISKIKFTPNLRDRYIDNKAIKLLSKVGITDKVINTATDAMDIDQESEVPIEHEVEDEVEVEVEEVEEETGEFRINSQNNIADDDTLESNFVPDISLTTELESIKTISETLADKSSTTD
ncbi:Mis12 protein-domain-containing protein [Scheffersomyces amazonensis]|uniref:Mis12 protein-domain-containing protein n=1 Tax=Scheffersomyces amazonensis TaxID=1078765 RepID=UPI00315CEBF3